MITTGSHTPLHYNLYLDLASCGSGTTPFFRLQIFREQVLDEGTAQKKRSKTQKAIKDSRYILCKKRHIHSVHTYYSLLCINSMMSIKSTSLFLSQKPLTSYDTYKSRHIYGVSHSSKFHIWVYLNTHCRTKDEAWQKTTVFVFGT